MNEFFVYSISVENKIIYVGQTKNFIFRCLNHLSLANVRGIRKFDPNTLCDLYKCINYYLSIGIYPEFKIVNSFNTRKDAISFEFEYTAINSETILISISKNKFDKVIDVKISNSIGYEIMKFYREKLKNTTSEFSSRQLKLFL